MRRNHTRQAVSHRRPQDRFADARGIPAAVTGSAREDGVDIMPIGYAWLDKDKLLQGQDWELEICKALRQSGVVVCLSRLFNQYQYVVFWLYNFLTEFLVFENTRRNLNQASKRCDPCAGWMKGYEMARKIFSWTLIVLSSIFLLLSVVGIGAAWYYNEPLTRQTTSQLKEIDTELSQAQATLTSTQTELERALRIVDAAEKALEKLSQQSTDAKSIFDNIKGALDDNLIPGLKTTRGTIDSARTTLESLQTTLKEISSFVPSVDLNGPSQILTDLIDSAKSLDSQIADAEGVAQQASTFVGDTSYLMGGDLTETRVSLQNFLTAIQEYQLKVTGWRAQVADLTKALPTWIDRASISLTVFFLWFGLSQFGLLLHGLNLRRGGDPLEVLRRK